MLFHTTSQIWPHHKNCVLPDHAPDRSPVVVLNQLNELRKAPFPAIECPLSLQSCLNRVPLLDVTFIFVGLRVDASDVPVVTESWEEEGYDMVAFSLVGRDVVEENIAVVAFFSSLDICTSRSCRSGLIWVAYCGDF